MTATDYDFVQTRTEIINRAFRIIGAVAVGQQPTSNESAQAVQALNDLVKAWQNEEHIYLWSLTLKTQTLSAGTYSYALPTDPPFIWVDRAYLSQSGSDSMLEQITWQEYQEIYDKDSSGTPYSFAVNGQDSKIYLYPSPNATDTLYMLGVAKLKDWDSAAGYGDFPQRFQMALTYGLAHQLSHEYGLPLQERQAYQAQERYYLDKAKTSDRPRADEVVVKGAFDL